MAIRRPQPIFVGAPALSVQSAGVDQPETTSPMKHRLLSAALAATFAAAPSLHAAEWLAGISGNGRLVMFASDAPDEVTVLRVRGLPKQERLLALDVRPATGQLYALGSSSRLYTIELAKGSSTAVATAVGSGPFATPLSGSRFAFDFNPPVDRIRIMSDTGQNLRAHPDTGAIAAVDASLAYAAGDPGFATAPAVTACAYINNDNDPLTGTVLFNLDSARGTLVRQDPPNAGTLNTVGSLGLPVADACGFDIAGSDGTAYASVVLRDGRRKEPRATLVTIDIASGAATVVGKIGSSRPITSLTALGTTAE